MRVSVRFFAFALLSSDAMSLRSLARSRLDCSCPILALARSFTHVDRLLLGPVLYGHSSITALARARSFYTRRSPPACSDQYRMAIVPSALACARSFDRLLLGPVPYGHSSISSRMRTIFRSPPGRTSTTWLVVWGRDHRNRAHAIKV